MKKQFILIALSLILFSCKQDPGEIRGVVTYFFNDNFGQKPDVGATIYVTNITNDSLLKIPLAIKFLNKYEKDSNDIKKYKTDIKYNTDYIKNEGWKEWPSIEYQKEYKELHTKWLSEAKENLNKAIGIIQKDLDTLKITHYDQYPKFIQRIINDKETLKSQVDANGNYSIPQVKPDNYTVLIYTANRGKNIPPKIMNITVDSKQIVSVNAKFD